MNVVISSLLPKKLVKIGGNPAVFCSDSVPLAAIPTDGAKFAVDNTAPCFAMRVLSIACSKFIFSSKNIDKN